MIHVCDAIMGTGKTSATITFFNEHPDGKYIFISPFLSEDDRIKEGCRGLGFVTPSRAFEEYNHAKIRHTAALIKSGKNIATTHQAFRFYTEDMLADIIGQGYTLVIDENVDVLEKCTVPPGDLAVAIDGGYIVEENDEYYLTDKKYQGGRFDDLFSLLKTRRLLRLSSNDDGDLHYWALPAELIMAFKEVYVLTYLFEGQSLHHLFHMNGIEYDRIGIERTEDGGYRFGAYPGYFPEYISNIKSLITILDNPKMNAVGDNYYAMSINWFDKRTSEVDALKKNLHNYFGNIHSGLPAAKKMYGVIGESGKKLRGKGYSNRGIAFNKKATNEYRECTCLAYPVNVFMDVTVKNYYAKHGFDVNEDEYALSNMVQWIWRGAIRDGEKIQLYIPSRRMRTILMNWMDSLEKGGIR